MKRAREHGGGDAPVVKRCVTTTTTTTRATSIDRWRDVGLICDPGHRARVPA